MAPASIRLPATPHLPTKSSSNCPTELGSLPKTATRAGNAIGQNSKSDRPTLLSPDHAIEALRGLARRYRSGLVGFTDGKIEVVATGCHPVVASQPSR